MSLLIDLQIRNVIKINSYHFVSPFHPKSYIDTLFLVTMRLVKRIKEMAVTIICNIIYKCNYIRSSSAVLNNRGQRECNAQCTIIAQSLRFGPHQIDRVLMVMKIL